ncbi:competence protein ComEC [Halobacillus karajensis]|uniref:DNA internalization-related competence protein ComEC/Rec2 n=1 Tax=Halobacillus karajensis TaxID=195088 RepID=UPI0008A7325A|nr:DNA internalization-related competence protein ComEC/Rec2 [Halobacillus karajensis]SEH60071.1 competence protein ComEC [Halobacillus karajensis]
MLNLKGNWHILAIAFVLGGVLSNQEGLAVYLILILLMAWLFIYRFHFLHSTLLLLFVFIGYTYLSPISPHVLSHSSPAKWEGIITPEIKNTEHTLSLILKDQSGDKKQIRYIKKDDEDIHPQWKVGATCIVEGNVEPFEAARNPGQFDYQSYMGRMGIFSQVIIKEPSNLTCEGESWMNQLLESREILKGKVKTNVSDYTYRWMNALVFGDTDLLDSSIVDWFREFNLSHILAISGLHVGLTIGGLYWLFFRSGLITKRQSKFILVVFLPVYMFLSGGAPSVMRAGLMAGVLMLTGSFQRKFPLTDILSIICLLFLFLSPSYFHHIGFQFSFLVTFSLLLTIPILKHYTNTWMQSAVIGLTSQLSILALQVHYFYEFQPFSLWMNMIAVPYFSFFVIPGLMVILVVSFLYPPFSSFLSSLFQDVHEIVLSYMIHISECLDFLWVIGEISMPYVVLYTLCFIQMMRIWEKGEKWKTFLASCAVVGVFIVWCLSPYLSEKGTLTMLDVGQGDSFIIELPYRRGIVMVDAAGPPVYASNKERTAEDVILPYLKSKGIHRIDAMFITHDDTDHSGSAPYIVDDIDVHRIYVSPYHKEEYHVAGKAERIKAGQKLLVGDHAFDVLHPSDVDHKDSNENSLVLHSIIGGKQWLFTGDISKRIEQGIVEHYPSLKVDVLKVAPPWKSYINIRRAAQSLSTESGDDFCRRK